MWVFKAIYYNMNTGKKIARVIKFDKSNFLATEKDCYIYAMSKTYDMKQENECLSSLEFVEC